jgi:mono/diheme cytochrome c family protein
MLLLNLLLTTCQQSTTPPKDFSLADFVNRHCIQCHQGDKAKGSLSLEKFDPASILKNRAGWEHSVERTQGGDMPPASRKTRPTPAEIEAFTNQVNAIFEAADLKAKPDPGLVPPRRLNRVEYANTLKDLLGVDFNPAGDFPSDDIGHGFDNNAETLSLPPLLMERYLSAAESALDKAIQLKAPKPALRNLAARYLEPALKDPSAVKRFRELKEERLFQTYKVTEAGEYTLRFKAYGIAGGGQPPEVAIVEGEKRVLVKVKLEVDEKNPRVIEAKTTLRPRQYKLGLRLENPGAGRVVMVEWAEIEGPADTRPSELRDLLGVDEKLPADEKIRQVVSRFAGRAWRGQVDKRALQGAIDLAIADGAKRKDWLAGAKTGMLVVLCSPRFLFRLETDDRPPREEPYDLTDLQVASRLSYFLWSTMPDQELLELAGDERLTANLDAQVDRMLHSDRSRALVENFFPQWLQIQRLDSFQPDKGRFPSFNEQLRRAMKTEAQKLFEEIVQQDGSVLDIINADHTWLNQRLASHYGIADTKGTAMGAKPKAEGGKPIVGEEFVRVELAEQPRGGVLGMAAVLSVTSNPTRTSPVKRGKWVLEQLMGTPPPPPPPNVPELEATAKSAKAETLRQRMELHRANPACSTCHQKMDALGFAFEAFNALGALRDKDEGQPIDASGELPGGRKVAGMQDVRSYLVENKDKFVKTMAERLMVYALGRGLTPADRKAVEGVVEATKKGDYKFSAMVKAVVKSQPFRQKRGRDQEPAE